MEQGEAHEEMDEVLGGLIGLVMLVAIVGYAALMLSSHAVLFSETPTDPSVYAGFRCSYFTGTRVVETYTNNRMGCPRFTKVGD